MKKSRFTKTGITFGIVAIALACFAAFGIWNTLRGAENYEPENTVSAMDNTRSQVLVSGKEYKLDNDQKKQHENQEKQRQKAIEIKQEENIQNRSRTEERQLDNEGEEETKKKDKKSKKETEKSSDGDENGEGGNKKDGDGDGGDDDPSGDENKDQDEDDNGGGGGDRDDDNGNGDEKTPEEQETDDPDDEAISRENDDDEERSYHDLTPEEQAKRPTIKFSFPEGRTISGKKLKFWITATDSTGQNIPVYSNGSGNFTVWVNGTQVRSSGTSGNKTNFKISNPLDGENKIKVKAEDRKGYTRTVTRKVNVNVNGPEETVGSVTVTIEAPSISLGTIAGPMEIPITEEESCDEILEDAFKKAGLGYSMPSKGGQGAYLVGISRKDIAKNAEISEELQEKIEKAGGSPKPVIGNIDNWPKDRIFEKDFVNTSGWMYFVNGDGPQVGLSAFVPEDGDEIRVVFTLLGGADL